MTAVPTPAEQARAAAELLGSHLAAFVTGDLTADDIAEFIAYGFIRTDDRYREPDETDTDRGNELIHQLSVLASALDRLAADVRRGDTSYNALRWIR